VGASPKIWKRPAARAGSAGGQIEARPVVLFNPDLRILGQLFPVTHFIEIMRGVVLRGAGPVELWRSCLALVLISVALIVASVRKFQKISLV
jgi:ABC-type polysaccharide/polyol phosphate export permease